jgi:hypothetical protein
MKPLNAWSNVETRDGEMSTMELYGLVKLIERIKVSFLWIRRPLRYLGATKCMNQIKPSLGQLCGRNNGRLKSRVLLII